MSGCELPDKVVERVKGVGTIEAFLIFAVAAFDFTVMSGRIRTNELMSDAQFSGGDFKVSLFVAVGV